MLAENIKAVLFDFGGVVLTSPFDAFARHEEAEGLPAGIIRNINATNPDDNAWARFERSDVDAAGFVELFEAEAAALGHRISGWSVLELISGDVRPFMVEAIRRVKSAGFITACLTNNFTGDARPPTNPEREAEVRSVMSLFDHVVESSVIGVRKPEADFYLKALEIVGVTAAESVFLDDLGINLKPARAMGMTTIKVVDPHVALAELAAVIGVDLDSRSAGSN
ncbi:MAG: HAD-IA family hydrolase [Actinomycetota bacterium]